MALRTFESERDALIAYVHTLVQMVTFKCASDFRFARLFSLISILCFYIYTHTYARTHLFLSPFWCSLCAQYVLFMFVWGWLHEEFLDLFSIRSRLRKSIFHFLCSLLFKSAFQIWHISEFGKLHGSKLEASEWASERKRMRKMSHSQQMLFDFLTKQINRIVWYFFCVLSLRLATTMLGLHVCPVECRDFSLSFWTRQIKCRFLCYWLSWMHVRLLFECKQQIKSQKMIK